MLLRQKQNFTKPATQIKEYTNRKAGIKRSKQLHPGKCPKGSSSGNNMLQKRHIHGVVHSVPEQVALWMESWAPGTCLEIPIHSLPPILHLVTTSSELPWDLQNAERNRTSPAPPSIDGSQLLSLNNSLHNKSRVKCGNLSFALILPPSNGKREGSQSRQILALQFSTPHMGTEILQPEFLQFRVVPASVIAM